MGLLRSERGHHRHHALAGPNPELGPQPLDRVRIDGFVTVDVDPVFDDDDSLPIYPLDADKILGMRDAQRHYGVGVSHEKPVELRKAPSGFHTTRRVRSDHSPGDSGDE